MEYTYHVSADVHFDEDDLKALRNLLTAIETAAGDLDSGLRGLDLGGGAERLYHELRNLVDRRF